MFGKLLLWHHIHLEHTDFIGIVFLASIKKLHHVALADGAVENLEVGDNASERIEYRVEDQALQRSILIAFRSWNTLYHSIKDILDVSRRTNSWSYRL